MRTQLIVGVIVVAVLLIGGWLVLGSSGDDAGSETPAPAGETDMLAGGAIPNLTLNDNDDNEVRLVDLAGKPLVLNAWATWCPFCVDELPAFVAAQQQLGDAVTIVAIDRAEPGRVAQEYTDQLGLSDELLFLLDPTDSFYQAIGGFSMPETLFINSDGSLGFHKRGPMSTAEIVQRIGELQ